MTNHTNTDALNINPITGDEAPEPLFGALTAQEAEELAAQFDEPVQVAVRIHWERSALGWYGTAFLPDTLEVACFVTSTDLNGAPVYTSFTRGTLVSHPTQAGLGGWFEIHTGGEGDIYVWMRMTPQQLKRGLEAGSIVRTTASMGIHPGHGIFATHAVAKAL